jgi:PAS domain-containing protein
MVPRAKKPGAGLDDIRGSKALAYGPSLGFAVLFVPSSAHAAEAIGPLFTGDLLLLLIVLTSGALAIAGGLWGLAERRNTVALRDSLRAMTAKARALLSARDAWLSAGRESLMVWGADMSAPLSFGEGAALMEACLVGPDATDLSAALDALAANGTSFALLCRTNDGRTIHVRGRPAGGSVAVFLEPESRAEAKELDLQAIVDAVPIPVWIRRPQDLALTFTNRAFLTASGTPSREAALQMNVAFDRSERDLASTARIDNEIVEAKRFAVISGHRRALNFTLAPLPNGTIVGSAIDVTASPEAEAKLQRYIDAHAETLDRLGAAGAILGCDKKLTL